MFQAWVQMWDGVELIVTDPDRAREQVTEVAAVEVYEQLVNLYDPTVEGGNPSTPRTFDNNAVLSGETANTAVIDDCVFESPRAGNQTLWYRGTVSVAGGGSPRIDSLEVVNPIGCVPQELADAAIGAYEGFLDAEVAFWDPADPDHPLVEQTMTDPQLSFIRGLLVEHRADGLVLRGRPVTHPEIIEVRSPDEVVILDCHELDPAQGLFDRDTGARVAGVEEAAAGDLGLQSAVMLRSEEGAWKVSDLQGRDKVDCDFAPTPQGLPSV
jgi:hypothetical protein